MSTLSQETEAFAARVAAAREMSLHEAVRQALEVWAGAESLPKQAVESRDFTPAAVAKRKVSLDGIVAEIAALPVLDPRSPPEIMDDLDPLADCEWRTENSANID